MSAWSDNSEAPGCRQLLIGYLLVLLLIGLVLLVARIAGAAEARSGFAAHYRPGLMERVRDRRIARGELPATAARWRDLVASPHHPIGTALVITSRRGRVVALVVDVPHPRDRRAILARGIIAELAFETNRALCPPRERPEACRVVVERRSP